MLAAVFIDYADRASCRTCLVPDVHKTWLCSNKPPTEQLLVPGLKLTLKKRSIADEEGCMSAATHDMKVGRRMFLRVYRDLDACDGINTYARSEECPVRPDAEPAAKQDREDPCEVIERLGFRKRLFQ
jgi:hypothetical protein